MDPKKTPKKRSINQQDGAHNLMKSWWSSVSSAWRRFREDLLPPPSSTT